MHEGGANNGRHCVIIHEPKHGQRQVHYPLSRPLFLLSCNVVDGTFSVYRLPFVQANLFHTVIFTAARAVKAVILCLLSTTMYFWDSNEQRLVLYVNFGRLDVVNRPLNRPPGVAWSSNKCF